ncbi:alpha/beta fold hydrolase [Aquibium sp. ELW1220]|uniref:alpha/beta hydrolase n=1 Tax=Aquibium sp. ELW1220 TaxID=2976766 RepID=UPI0025AF41D4|nr:alpha/beta fold hydrolase [Aquibium sp. ELW1220]MDN2580521.1 lysophospholipase [Aquibium sp. ELW1220]
MFEKLIAIAAIFVAICIAIALTLVASSAPPAAGGQGAAEDETLDFAPAFAQDLSDLPASSSFDARDGTALPFRRYPGAPGRYVVLIHGSGWHGMQFHAMAKRLAAAGLGTVIVPDMRGHGEAPVRRGDIDHIGQLEEDTADLIVALRDEAGGQARVVLGGHSSGGGFVVRFAGGTYGDMVDAYVLMAPFLKYDAPTTRPDSGGWAQPATRRIIGLIMLNAVGVTALNHLPVISFAMPKAVLDGPLGHTATTSYSYRLNTSFAPRSDYQADLKAMTAPFLLIAGADDEAFFADRYEATIAPHAPGGSYVVLPGVGHLAIVSNDAAIAAVETFLKGLSGD